ncbi:MAG: hypothetical protein Greene101447_117, partial [Parcubacteria group bacterium Greene1014_47]
VALLFLSMVLTRENPSEQAPLPAQGSIESFVNQMLSQEQRREEDPSVVDVPLAEPCEGANHTNFDCYEDYFKNTVKQQSIVYAFDALKTIYPSNEYARAQCHPITHVIGQEASKKFATVAEAYTQGDSFCWSGYYHGVLEGVIAKIGYTNLASQMDDICAPLAKARQYSFDHYNCVHGLGHGIMAITQDELFQSLETCNVLSDTWERQSCWSGAFMENIIIDNKNHFTKYLKPEDPLYPCNEAGKEYKGTCYLMQTSYMLKLTNGDFAKVFEQCAMADEGFQDICYQSLGRDASGRSVSNVQQTKATCILGKDFQQQSNCVIGAVKDFISYHHSDIQAKELCSSLESLELQQVCKSTSETYAKVL